MKVEGWLLDLYSRQGEMVLWIKKRSGEPARLTDRWDRHLYVAGDFADLITLASRDEIADRCILVEKYERLSDHEKSKVLQINVGSDKEAESLAKKILRWGNYERYRLYNVDVPSSQMYLYEKDIFPLASVEAIAEQGRVSWRLLDRVEDTDYSLPQFRVVRLSLETMKEIRIRTFEDKLAGITIGLDGESLVIDSGSEVEKLLKFISLFNEVDPDIVITEDGDSFLFPYLSHRADVNEVLRELKLGREGIPLHISEVKGSSYFSYGRVYYRSSTARLHGRIHIDEGNAYLYSDCGLEGLIEVARTCRIPIQRASRSTIGTSMTSLQLYQAVKDDILIPWNKNETEDFKDGLELLLADRGGFIFEPKTGIHDSVGEVDFSSLYPTLMMTKNLSAETVNCSCCPDSSNRVPELDYNICSKRIGIVPKTLRVLLKKRAEYKGFKKETDPPLREIYERRQAALKWILVCSFGYLGFKNARFGKIDAHVATCAFARDALKRAMRIAESRGFRVIHGIVDSLWLKKEGASREDYERLCEEIERKTHLPISFEGLHKWIVFLKSKTNANLPVLNRYYGVFEDGKMKVRGIDLRRHDTPKLIRDCQEEMLQVLAKASNSTEYHELLPNALQVLKKYVEALKLGRVRIEDLIIEKYLSKKPCEYENQTLQAIASQHLTREGLNIYPGQTVRYLIVNSGAKITENKALPAELINEKTTYDAGRYIELLLFSAANLLTS